MQQRLRRLEKLDLLQLLEASKAIARSSESGEILENPDELRNVVQSIADAAAPRQWKTMAKEAGWEWMYAVHRFCSTAIHPGLGTRARLANEMGAGELQRILCWTYSGAVSAAGGMASAVLPDVELIRLKHNMLVFANAGLVVTPPPESGA